MRSDYSKFRLFEGRISNGLVFKWLGFSYAYCLVPAIGKLDHLKSKQFSPDLKWFLTKQRPFVWISNGWASGSHSLSGPFATQPLFNHSKSRPVQIPTVSFVKLVYGQKQVGYLNGLITDICSRPIRPHFEIQTQVSGIQMVQLFEYRTVNCSVFRCQVVLRWLLDLDFFVYLDFAYKVSVH